MSIKFPFFLIFLLIASSTYSQNELEYTPINRDLEAAKKPYKISTDFFESQIENYKGDYKKDYKSIIQSNIDDLKHVYNNIFFNSKYNQYVNDVVHELQKNNPEIANEPITAYLYLDESINAFSTGDHTIFVNLGIFEVLNNEAEFAFVLGHELAHQIKDHSNVSLQDKLNLFYSKSVQKDLKQIKKQGVHGQSSLNDFMKSFTIKDRVHGRLHEEESDSFSLRLIQNTNYDEAASINSLLSLRTQYEDSIDISKQLRETFSFENAPFNDKWLYHKETMAEKMKFTISDELKDSMATHPNTLKRYNKLLETPSKGHGDKEYVVSESLFDEIKYISRIQLVDYLIKSNNYSKALFQILMYQSFGYNNKYFDKAIYTILDKFHTELNKQMLSNFIEFKNPYFPKEYNKLLIFINNLSYSDMESLKDNYKLKHKL